MLHEFVPHVFAQGHTIEGAIRLHNSLKMLPEHVELLVDEFNTINKDVFPPVAGQVVKIPIMDDYQGEDPIVEEPKEIPKEIPKLPPLRQYSRPIVRKPKKKEPEPMKEETKKVVPRKNWWN